MGKLITMGIFKARRNFEYATEEQAAIQRGLNEWYRMRYAPDRPPDADTIRRVGERSQKYVVLLSSGISPFADIIQRVTAAGERIRARERAEREQAWRESIARMLRERRERLSAPPAPAASVIAFHPATIQAKRRRRRRAKVISFKRAYTVVRWRRRESNPFPAP